MPASASAAVGALTCLFVLGVLGGATRARAELVLGAYLGSTKTQSASLAIAQPEKGTDVALERVTYSGGSFTPPLYYGARIAWFPRGDSWFGVEAEFIHLKAYADTTASTRASGRHHGAAIDATVRVADVIERFSISHGLNFLLANAVMRRAIGPASGARGVTVSARLGLGPTIPHAESVVDGVPREGYALGAVGVQAAAGVEVRLSAALALMAEYKFTRTRQAVDIDRGEARGLFASHHVVLGGTWIVGGRR